MPGNERKVTRNNKDSSSLSSLSREPEHDDCSHNHHAREIEFSGISRVASVCLAAIEAWYLARAETRARYLAIKAVLHAVLGVGWARLEVFVVVDERILTIFLSRTFVAEQAVGHWRQTN